MWVVGSYSPNLTEVCTKKNEEDMYIHDNNKKVHTMP